MLADCSVGGAITRDPGQYVAEVPGLAANRTTLTRGDRLGTAAQRGDTQQVKKRQRAPTPTFERRLRRDAARRR